MYFQVEIDPWEVTSPLKLTFTIVNVGLSQGSQIALTIVHSSVSFT
jgi:hypothetical protein